VVEVGLGSGTLKGKRDEGELVGPVPPKRVKDIESVVCSKRIGGQREKWGGD